MVELHSAPEKMVEALLLSAKGRGDHNSVSRGVVLPLELKATYLKREMSIGNYFQM
jgi:hypothetical protein